MASDQGRERRVYRYEDILRAVGRYVDQHDLQDVVVMQIEEGVLVRGVAPVSDRRSAGRQYVQHLFTQDDLEQIDEEARRRRGQGTRLHS